MTIDLKSTRPAPMSCGFGSGRTPMDAAYVEFPEPVAIDDIVVHTGREELDETVVAQLIETLQSRAGFFSPVLVRWVEGKGPVLVDGLNRLTAAKRLGWRAVPVAQADLDDEAAILAEFQANNIRRHYDAASLTRRTNAVSELRARVRAQDANADAAEEAKRAARDAEIERRKQTHHESDSRALADVSGLSQRTIQLRQQWGRDITDASWGTIEDNPCLNNVRVFKKVAATPDAEQPSVLAQILRDGGNVIEPDKEFKALSRAWKGASSEARERFLREVMKCPDALRRAAE
jgi:hypothetical protein